MCMSRMMFWGLASAMCGSTFAGTQFFAGDDLLTMIRSDDERDRNGSFAYVAAIADALNLGTSIEGWKACLPQQATVGEVREVARKFLEASPQRRQVAAASLVARALEDKFPCSSGARKPRS